MLPEIVYQALDTGRQSFEEPHTKSTNTESKVCVPLLLTTQTLSIAGYNCNEVTKDGVGSVAGIIIINPNYVRILLGA
jgi:hypothetical protein